MKKPYKTLVVGFGGIADTLGDDARMAQHFAYATHAQVLARHPRFDWCAVVDSNAEARARALNKWEIRDSFATIEEAANASPEIAILATPPGERTQAIEALETLCGIIVEKPIGANYRDALAFAKKCGERNLVVQVNMLRRADSLTRTLAAGGLTDHVGRIQAVFGLYGRGFYNTGPHIIDLARMLLGDVRSVRALSAPRLAHDAVLDNDVAIPFVIEFANDVIAAMQSLDYRAYREAGLDFWGSDGRLSILQEGLGIYCYPRTENRGVADAMEVASDQPKALDGTYGDALYRLYDNLAAALDKGTPLWSPLENALQTEAVMDAVMISSANDGARQYLS